MLRGVAGVPRLGEGLRRGRRLSARRRPRRLRPRRSPSPSCCTPTRARAVVVVRSMADAHRWTQDLKFFGAPVLEFPEREPRLWRGGHHREADAERAVIARRLGAGEPVVVVATPAGLDTPLPPPAEFAARTLRIGVGDRLERELLLEAFETAGYERVETVVEVGQWSVRGGIVDVFVAEPPEPGAARVLRRRRRVDPPLRSHLPALDRRRSTSCWCCRSAPADDDGRRRPPARLPAGAGAGDPRRARAARRDRPRRRRAAGRSREVLGERPARRSWSWWPAPATEHVLDTQEVPRFTGHFVQLTEALGRWRAEGFTVRLVVADERQAEHLRQILRDHDVEAPIAASIEAPESPAIVVGECSAGIADPGGGPRAAHRGARSSAPAAARCAGRSTSAAPRSRPSPTSRSATWSSTRTTASAATSGCARCRSAIATATSCCSSTPRAAGCTCRSSGSTSSRSTSAATRAPPGSTGWAAPPGSA